MSVVEQRPVVQEAIHSPLAAQNDVKDQNPPKNENASLVNRLAKNIFVQLGLILAVGAVCLCTGVESIVFLAGVGITTCVALAIEAALRKQREKTEIMAKEQAEIWKHNADKKEAIDEVKATVEQVKLVAQELKIRNSATEVDARKMLSQALVVVGRVLNDEIRIGDNSENRRLEALTEAQKICQGFRPEVVDLMATALHLIYNYFDVSKAASLSVVAQADVAIAWANLSIIANGAQKNINTDSVNEMVRIDDLFKTGLKTEKRELEELKQATREQVVQGLFLKAQGFKDTSAAVEGAVKHFQILMKSYKAIEVRIKACQEGIVRLGIRNIDVLEKLRLLVKPWNNKTDIAIAKACAVRVSLKEVLWGDVQS